MFIRLFIICGPCFFAFYLYNPIKFLLCTQFMGISDVPNICPALWDKIYPVDVASSLKKIPRAAVVPPQHLFFSSHFHFRQFHLRIPLNWSNSLPFYSFLTHQECLRTNSQSLICSRQFRAPTLICCSNTNADCPSSEMLTLFAL